MSHTASTSGSSTPSWSASSSSPPSTSSPPPSSSPSLSSTSSLRRAPQSEPYQVHPATHQNQDSLCERALVAGSYLREGALRVKHQSDNVSKRKKRGWDSRRAPQSEPYQVHPARHQNQDSLCKRALAAGSYLRGGALRIRHQQCTGAT